MAKAQTGYLAFEVTSDMVLPSGNTRPQPPGPIVPRSMLMVGDAEAVLLIRDDCPHKEKALARIIALAQRGLSSLVMAERAAASVERQRIIDEDLKRRGLK